VDSLPDPLLLRKSGSAGNRTLTTRTQRWSINGNYLAKSQVMVALTFASHGKMSQTLVESNIYMLWSLQYLLEGREERMREQNKFFQG
jgi:hypothetical protein